MASDRRSRAGGTGDAQLDHESLEVLIEAPERSRIDPGAGPTIDVDVPFKIAKQQFVDDFARRFMTALLERHDWNIAAAARATGVDRVSIHKLLDRLSLRRP